jgi:hypothetical protein
MFNLKEDIKPFIRIVEGICELFEKEIYKEDLHLITKIMLVNIFLELESKISENLELYLRIDENEEIKKLKVRISKIDIYLSEFGIEFSKKAENAINTLFSELNKNKGSFASLKESKEKEIIY